jgi:hypothetical protein
MFLKFAIAVRGLETLAMLLVPSICSQHRLFDAGFRLSDQLSLIAMVAATVSLYLFSLQHIKTLITMPHRGPELNEARRSSGAN